MSLTKTRTPPTHRRAVQRHISQPTLPVKSTSLPTSTDQTGQQCQAKRRGGVDVPHNSLCEVPRVSHLDRHDTKLCRACALLRQGSRELVSERQAAIVDAFPCARKRGIFRLVSLLPGLSSGGHAVDAGPAACSCICTHARAVVDRRSCRMRFAFALFQHSPHTRARDMDAWCFRGQRRPRPPLPIWPPRKRIWHGRFDGREGRGRRLTVRVGAACVRPARTGTNVDGASLHPLSTLPPSLS